MHAMSASGMMTYFREAVIHTDALLDLLVKCENKVGNSVNARGSGFSGITFGDFEVQGQTSRGFWSLGFGIWGVLAGFGIQGMFEI